MFLSTIARQPVGAEVGNTHASSVIAVVRRSEGASGIVTCDVVPLNTSALPNLPAVQVVAVATPLLFCPEASRIVVPDPSSNPYAATRPLVSGVSVVIVTMLEKALRLPAASVARTQ